MENKSVNEIVFGRMAPGISVRDIQVSYEFYSKVLGFRKVFENGSPVGFMVLKKDGAELHLSQKRDHQASITNVAHMFVDDARSLYQACESAGVRIIKALADKEYGQRAFVFADPDGNRIDVGESTK